MLHRTSREGFAWRIAANPLQALLYDFDIDGAELKLSHRQFLQENVVLPLLKDPYKKWQLKLRGWASRSGSAAYNVILSSKRVEAVMRFIRNGYHGDIIFDHEGLGEVPPTLAGRQDGSEDLFYRAVWLSFCGLDQTLPPVPRHLPKPPPPPIGSTKYFGIQIITGRSLTYTAPIPLRTVPRAMDQLYQAGVSIDDFFVEITDQETGKSYLYHFTGLGKTLGPSGSYKGFGGTVTFQSHTGSRLEAPRWLTGDKFEGSAKLEIYGISWGMGLAKQKSNFYFRPLHWYSPGFGFCVENFDTGTTIGPFSLGLSSTTGELRLVRR
jgi:hypothetical protein